MTQGKLIPKLTALELLEVLDSQIDEDNPAGSMAHTVIRAIVAEVTLLREIEIAALLLADIVTGEDHVIQLPTADSQVIKTIRMFAQHPKSQGVKP